MANNISYEKTRFRDRAAELATLFSFIIVSLITSIVVMDIIIYPIALLSVKNKALFNILIARITWIFIISFLIYSISRKIFFLLRDGIPISEILKRILLKPIKILGIVFVIAILSFSLIYLIFKLISYNHYLLYKIINM